MRVSDVLRNKGNDVATIPPTATVEELLATLAEHGVGALVVTTDAETVEGIVSERDVVRHLHRRGTGLLAEPVRAIMTTDVRTCTPDEPVDLLARTMTERRFRHMPVLQDGVLAGIVSIGDIVKSRIGELEGESAQLQDYIAGAR